MPPFGFSSSCRDRTSEFLAITERLRQQQGAATSSNHVHDNGGAAPLSGPPSGGAAAQQSEFARGAARIGQGIHSTSQKLAQLSQLAKRTSMFDDPAQEINDLTSAIKQDIQGLNVALVKLQEMSGSTRDGNKQSSNHSHTVVDSLRTRLKDATKEFKDVLTLRTESLKVHQERRTLFSAPPSGSRGGTGPSQPFGRAAPLFPSTAKGNLQGGSARSTPEQQPLLQHSQQQQQLLAPQDTYLTSRAEALQNVESTIVELGGIFQQLAQMVQEQGEMAARIDENVDDTLANVDSAQAQLLRYLNSISSNRWLLLKIFFVLMAFLVIFVVFIA